VAAAPHELPPTEPSLVVQLADLDALVGELIIADEPEIYWEDSHGHFQFDTAEEARLALADPFYQDFLPHVDWAQTVVRQVQAYRPYSSDASEIWRVVERAAADFGSMKIWREAGRWHASFGSHADAAARTSGVAICLAALLAKGVHLDVNLDRLDAQLGELGVAPEQRDLASRDPCAWS
jgi:hypothetical protein